VHGYVVLSVLSVAGVSCGDGGTAPAVPFSATPAELAVVAAAVDDAGSRLASSLSDQALGAELADLLADLSLEIEANRADRASPILERVLAALVRTAPTTPTGDVPDRAAIDLALTQVAELLQQ
jgi:hypothetical protein